MSRRYLHSRMDFSTLKVVPILNGKRPGFEGWPTAAKPMDQWPQHERWGLVHGPANGTWALDLDVKGANGLDSLAELEAKHGALPPTLMVKTPSGGVHLIFKWPSEGGIGNPVGLRPGIDARGEAGQSLIPPSPGYEWDTSHSSEPAVAPSWLLALVRRQEAPEGKVIQDAQAYKDAALTNLSRVEAGNGERQKRTYTVAKDLGRLARAAEWDPESIILEVREAARANGLEEERIDDTVPRAVWEGYREGGVEIAPAYETPMPKRLGMPMPDYLALDHPPLKMLVEPYVSEGSITVVYGAPASLKTWFALDVVKQAADKGRRVMLVEEEGRPSRLALRFKRMGITHRNVWAVIRQGVRLDDPKWLALLEETIKEGRFELVVLDPFADLHQLDENEQKEMRQLVERLKGLSVRTGAGLLLVHHTTKAGWQASKDFDQVGLHVLRGAGSLGAALDMAIQLIREKDVDIKASYVHVTKDKDNVMPNPHPARMELNEAEDGTITMSWMDGDAVKEAQADAKAKREDEKQDKKDAEDQKVLNIIRGEPGVGIKTLARLTKRSDTYVRAVITRLMDKGLIERRNGRLEAV